jgi:hypothetical protein
MNYIVCTTILQLHSLKYGGSVAFVAHDCMVHLNVLTQVWNVNDDQIRGKEVIPTGIICGLLEIKDVKKTFILHKLETNIDDK